MGFATHKLESWPSLLWKLVLSLIIQGWNWLLHSMVGSILDRLTPRIKCFCLKMTHLWSYFTNFNRHMAIFLTQEKEKQNCHVDLKGEWEVLVSTSHVYHNDYHIIFHRVSNSSPCMVFIPTSNAWEFQLFIFLTALGIVNICHIFNSTPSLCQLVTQVLKVYL